MVTKRNFGGYVRQHETYEQSARFEFCPQFLVFIFDSLLLLLRLIIFLITPPLQLFHLSLSP